MADFEDIFKKDDDADDQSSGFEDAFRRKPDPIDRPSPYRQQRDVGISGHEWVKRRLRNATWGAWGRSAKQNVGDVLSILKPIGRRPGAEGKEGAWSVAPNILELFALLNEMGMKPGDVMTQVGALQWEEGSKVSGAANIATGWLLKAPFKAYDILDWGEGDLGTDSETPRLDTVADFYVSRYNLSDPKTRALFGNLVDEDPIGVVVDAAFVLALGTSAAASTAKAGTNVAKAAGRRRAMRGLKRGTRFEDKLTSISRGADSVNRLVNKGGWHVPGIPSEIIVKGAKGMAKGAKERSLRHRLAKGIEGRMQHDAKTVDFGQGQIVSPPGKLLVKRPLQDLVEPGVVVLQGTIGIGGRVATRLVSPGGPGLVTRGGSGLDPARVKNAQAMGFGIEPILDADGNLIGINRLLDKDGNYTGPMNATLTKDNRAFLYEARMLREQNPEVIRQFERTVARIEERMGTIMDDAHESGDFGQARAAIKVEFEKYISDFHATYRDMIKAAGPVDDLPMDLTHTRAALRDILGEVEVGDPSGLTELSNAPDIKAFSEAMATYEESGQLQQALDDIAAQHTESGASAGSVKLDLDTTGTNERIAYSNDYKTKYQMRYELVELDDVIPSHDQSGLPNPNFESTLQTRDADMQFVNRIAAGLEPQGMVGDVPKISEGAPILNDQNMVLSGNHRTMALIQSIKDYPTRWADYKATLREVTQNYGIDPATLDGMKNPVLVRKVVDDIDEAQFAIEANMTPTRDMTAGEKASTDALRLNDDTMAMFDLEFDGDISDILTNQANEDAIKTYIAQFKQTELGGMSTKNKLNKQGIERITNAFMRRTFQGEYGARMLQTFLETKTEGMLNLNKAIRDALPALADLELQIRLGETTDPQTGLKAVTTDPSFSIHEDIAMAIHKMEALRKEGIKYVDFKKQQELPGINNLTPQALVIMDIVAEGIRKPSVLTEFINDYTNAARSEVPTEGSLFEMEIVSQDALIGRYITKHTEGIDKKLRDSLDKDLERIMKAEEAGHEVERGAAQTEKKAGAGKADIEVTDEIPPTYLYKNADLFETVLREIIEGENRKGVTDSRYIRWHQQVRNAMLVDMQNTIIAQMPDSAPQVRASRNYYRVGINKINSRFGETIYEIAHDKSASGVETFRNAVKTIFSPDMDPASVSTTYDLLGGRDSEAAQRARRIFISELFDKSRTTEQKADISRASRGKDAVAPATEKISPTGLTNQLLRFRDAANNYDDSLLNAIVGEKTMDSINVVDDFIRSHSTEIKTLRGSQTYFLLNDSIKQTSIIDAMAHLGAEMMGARSAGGQAAALFFVGAWLGPAAMSQLHRYIADKPIGQRWFLEGTKIVMNDEARRRASQLGRGARLQKQADREPQRKQNALNRIMGNRE